MFNGVYLEDPVLKKEKSIFIYLPFYYYMRLSSFIYTDFGPFLFSDDLPVFFLV